LIPSVLCVLLLAGIEALSIIAGMIPDVVVLGAVTLALGPLVVIAVVTQIPQQRRGKALLSRYGWRGAPATLLADKPCLARVGLDGAEVTLRLRRMNWIGKQALLRTGTLWVCGPDERGRALVRVAGSVGQALADVTDLVPSGVPPVLARPTGPRPADDPALIWARHAYHRGMVIIIGVLVLLTGVCVGFLTRFDFGRADSGTVGGLVAVPVMLLLIGWSYLVGLRALRRYADAPCWLPVQVSLDTWDTPATMAVRTGTGRLILPNGWHGYADFPRLPLDLAANLRATGVLWLAGEPTPGTTVPIGLPGYPLRAVVKIRG
jgi:hypothetical protein